MESDEELIRDMLTEDGYLLRMLGKDILNFFKDVEAEKTAALDFSDRLTLTLVTGSKRKISFNYSTKPAIALLSSLFAFGFHNMNEKPVDLDEFSECTQRALNDYISMKGMEGEMERKFRKKSLNESYVNECKSKVWFQELYKIEDGKVKIRCSLKNVISPKV